MYNRERDCGFMESGRTVGDGHSLWSELMVKVSVCVRQHGFTEFVGNQLCGNVPNLLLEQTDECLQLPWGHTHRVVFNETTVDVVPGVLTCRYSVGLTDRLLYSSSQCPPYSGPPPAPAGPRKSSGECGESNASQAPFSFLRLLSMLL